MLLSNSYKMTVTPKSGSTFSLPSTSSNSKGCNFRDTCSFIINETTQFSRIWLMAMLLSSHTLPSIHSLETFRFCWMLNREKIKDWDRNNYCVEHKREEKQEFEKKTTLWDTNATSKAQQSAMQLKRCYILQMFIQGAPSLKIVNATKCLFIRDHFSFLTFDESLWSSPW